MDSNDAIQVMNWFLADSENLNILQIIDYKGKKKKEVCIYPFIGYTETVFCDMLHSLDFPTFAE